MEISTLVAIPIALVLIAFLSGIEIAFISSNKLSIEISRKQKTSSGKFWSLVAENPTQFIGSILLAVNIVLVIYGLLIGEALAPLWKKMEVWFPALSESNISFIRLAFETIVATVVILIVEFLSKAFFRARSSSVLTNGFITYISQFFFAVFSSLGSLFIRASEWILKVILNVKLKPRSEVFSKVDLEQFVQGKSGIVKEEKISDINKELFENALTIGERRLRECLVPRKEIVGLADTSSIEDARKLFVETRLSKLIVYHKNIDDIKGYIHHNDLFKYPQQIADILLPIPMVPESMVATDLMNKFSEEQKSIAWVIDEFGGTAGIVTMEDLLEELFGEIKDEYDDVDELVEKRLAQNEFILSGRLELDVLESKYGLKFLETAGTETLSGYIIQHYGSIPRARQRIVVGSHEFDILNVSNTRIETVKLKELK